MENKFCLNDVNVLDNFFDKIDIQIMKFILKKTQCLSNLCNNVFFFEYLKHKIEIFYKNEFFITVVNVSANAQPGIQMRSFCGESDDEFLFCIYLRECVKSDDFTNHLMIKKPNCDFIRLIEQKNRRCVIFPSTFEHKCVSCPEFKNTQICVTLNFKINY
jgi:hypothetical protein